MGQPGSKEPKGKIMAAQKEKYDGVHFQVTLMNLVDGSVQGHAAGCADLTRKTSKYSDPWQSGELWDLETKADAWLGYNSDFLAEGGEDNAYEIDWLPCTSHIPSGDKHQVYVAHFGGEEEATPTPEDTVNVSSRKGSKWTYIYVGGELVAEVRNDQVGTVLDFLQKR